jgi:hypothetical protein
MATNPQVTQGAASIVFFYFGDSPYTSLFQETMQLKKAMEGYDFTVLLKHDDVPKWLDFSAADEKLADVKALPTAANLVRYIKELSHTGYFLDLWIFSHGWSNQFRASTGVYGDNSACTNTDITAQLDSAHTGLTVLPIRLVYQVNCYGQTMNTTWRSIGAKVTVGSRYVNFYPTQFGRFAEEWQKGTVSVDRALDAADTEGSRTVVQTYIGYVHAPSCNKEWGACPLGKTVLGDHACAKDYFTTKWLGDGEWQATLSGKENMNYSSTRMRGGTITLTKNTIPVWSA